MMNLHEEVNHIETHHDLAAFVEALKKDFTDHPSYWENQDLPTYLEALAAWLTDMDGYYKNRGENIPDSPSWRTIGELLLAAKIYE